jgi:hypothetical protein
MPPIISIPPNGTQHTHTNPATLTMRNAHDTHLASQVHSWRVKVGSVINGHNYYLGNELFPNGANTQNDPNVTLPNTGLCYTKVEYRKVSGGPWYSGHNTTFTCV